MMQHCHAGIVLKSLSPEISTQLSLNKDVAYNRGHLETQLTFYINKVNFYYEVNNIKYCIETNTGATV